MIICQLCVFTALKYLRKQSMNATSPCALGALSCWNRKRKKKKPEMLTLRKAPWYWHPRWSSALLIGRQSIRLSLFSAVCLPCWLGVRVVDTFIAVASLSETVSVFKRRSGEEGMSGVWHRGRGVLIVTRTSAQSRIKKRHPVCVYFWPCAQERTCSHFYSCVLFHSFAKEKHNDVFPIVQRRRTVCAQPWGYFKNLALYS